MQAKSTDSYNRNIITLKDINEQILYTFTLNSNETLNHQYLQIPLDEIEDDFYIIFWTQAVYSGLVDFSIYNIFLANEVPEEIQVSQLPQGQERVYILDGKDEYENYSGGWIQGEFRYYNKKYNGTSHIEIQDEYVIAHGISNGSGYATNSCYYTSNYFNKGEYTKLNVEFEATTTDNYERPIIILHDKTGSAIYSYTLKPKDTIERNILQIDLTEIDTEFQVFFQASALLGGTSETKVYNVFFSK